MFNFIKDKKFLIVGMCLIGIIFGIFGYFYFFSNNEEIVSDESITIKGENIKPVESNFYVDVKGAVKDPGVYLVSDGERVIDVIEKAGGLKNNANTTNINLSKRLESEMVVVVYTDKEVKNGKKSLNCDTKCECEVIEINNCIETETKLTQSAKININKASMEELMTLSGIGESKARAIISYREENGNFKTIEDIKNVTGIGESLYESIMDGITV